MNLILPSGPGNPSALTFFHPTKLINFAIGEAETCFIQLREYFFMAFKLFHLFSYHCRVIAFQENFFYHLFLSILILHLFNPLYQNIIISTCS